MDAINVVVRHPHSYSPGYTEPVIRRVPRRHAGWMSITYLGRRYQVLGGERVPYFIKADRPIKGRKGGG
jgi:hypothetical protein